MTLTDATLGVSILDIELPRTGGRVAGGGRDTVQRGGPAMKVVLFCGGLGTRLREYTGEIPKPMVKIGYRPILWHLMKYYAHFGHKDFVLCLGYKADVIKEFFLHYEEWISNDFTLSKGGRELTLENNDIEDWNITFVDTGLHANIGERLVAVRKYVEDEEIFLANYSDGLTDLDLDRDDRHSSGPATRWPRSWPCRRRRASTWSTSIAEGDVASHPLGERVEPAHQRRLLRPPPGDLRLHRAGRGARARAVRPPDQGAQAARLPLRPLLVHGHLQGAAAADRPVQLRPRAVGGLEERTGRGPALDDAPARASRRRSATATSCSASAPTATTSRSAAAARCCGCCASCPSSASPGWSCPATTDRAREARRGAPRVLGRHAGRPRRPGDASATASSPTRAVPIKEFFEQLKREVEPDLIFTHYRDDRHQDHRLVSELTYNTFRDHLVLEYEIMKIDGDLGNPNVYVPLDAAHRGPEGPPAGRTASARSATSAGSATTRSGA